MDDFPPSTAEYSMEYVHIEAALKSRWCPFLALVEEIKKFEPRPLSSYSDYRSRELTRLRGLNPGATDDSLLEIIDRQIATFVDPNFQFHEKFSERLMAEYVTVAFLSHALCEAAINAILAIGLAQGKTYELFNLVERADIKEKWQYAPKILQASYELPRGSSMFGNLTYLTKQRNALVHHKIQIHVDGKKVLDGSRFNRESYPDSLQWIRRFFSLPYDLVDHARKFLMPEFPIFVLMDRKPID